MSTEFSFIILTYNEEIHLPRLLQSIAGLEAKTFVLDSGSSDQTINICKQYRCYTEYHPFVNHPLQWSKALSIFPIKTLWVIGLDADQVICPVLYEILAAFKNEDYLDINGIYFNRKNIFKGKWIKNGGYYPKYLLKMFRYNLGYSDINENLDHKFQVPGKTLIWKNGHLIEENLKENSIYFWIEKHNRYSELLATEEVERMQFLRKQVLIPDFWGSPNERNASLKQLWRKLPRYIRPFLYIVFRLFIQKGILDGKTGIIFHFLQGFWFRLIVDIKIEEKLRELNRIKSLHILPLVINENSALKHSFTSIISIFRAQRLKNVVLSVSIIVIARFLAFKDIKLPVGQLKYAELKFPILFPALFCLIYFLNLAFIGITNPGGYYNHFIDQNLNYINWWRNFNITTVAMMLKSIGYDVYSDEYRLHVHGRAGFVMVYSCLGYGILSMFCSFVIIHPNRLKRKLTFLISGILVFQFLNIVRLLLIALYWKASTDWFYLNTHELFNYSIYTILALSTYFWLNQKTMIKG
jgi:exosortase/archaeosortase family protein